MLRHLPRSSARSFTRRRWLSSSPTATVYDKFGINPESLNDWIARPKEMVLHDTLNPEKLADVYITLPTRDGTHAPYAAPQIGNPVPYGHQLAFFHARTPEKDLRSDGTDPEYSPPEPFLRRMWVGGKMEWNARTPLTIGSKTVATSTVTSIVKKGFEKENPMLFLTQEIKYKMEGKEESSLKETRSHVYLPHVVVKRAVRQVKDLPSTSDFSFTYTPSLTTLFRYSALMFNAHHIHLDKDYTVKEGYPERLVHGPLTAMMLLETAAHHHPNIEIKSYEYRATNPIIVNKPSTIHGAWVDKSTAKLWCVDEEGVVGMTGSINVM